MSVTLSNTDSLLVAIPMVGILFIGFFRLDELVGKAKKKPNKRGPLAVSVRNGKPVCVDPDGTVADPVLRRR